MTPLLAVHAVATLALAGLVWFVQLVHYPLFARVPEEGFAGYEREHTRRTTWIATPLMVVEAACAALLAVVEPQLLTAAGLLLVGGVWASTFLVQVPCHRLLAEGWDADAHRRLVRSNWLRTGMWTVRGAIAIVLLV